MDEQLLKTASQYDQLGRDLFKAAMDGGSDDDTEYGVGSKLTKFKGGFMALVRKLKSRLKEKIGKKVIAPMPAQKRSRK